MPDQHVPSWNGHSGNAWADLQPMLDRLYQPFELTRSDGKAYWLVYPENRRNVPKIKAFRNWILEEMKAAGN